MHRLLVTRDLLEQDTVSLPKEAAHHLKVLRPKSGEEIELFDGQGATRRFHWDASACCLASPLPLTLASASPRPLTLFACVTKGSRWDWTIEKAVELGATRIVPVISDRTIVRIAPNERAAKTERWRRIAEDAARQSDAIWLPEICEPVDFKDSLPLVRACGRVFVGALVSPPAQPLMAAIAAHSPTECQNSYGIYVGPEGDFTSEELTSLLAIATPVSFGPTVLRAETAAIFGLAVLAAAGHTCS